MKKGTTNRSPEALTCLLLALVTVVVYWPVHSFEFLNYDDQVYVAANPHVFHGLSRQSIIWAFKAFQADNWHPITLLSHMLDCQMFGHDAGLHHLTNLFFHTANTLLLFALFRFLTGATFRSALVAALFALHPLHVESVAWISERKDVLSTFFGLLALHAYARYAVRSKAAKPKVSLCYFLSFLFFALSLMSKPMLVTLPFLLLLMDFWPLQRWHLAARRRLLWEKLPFLALSLADSIVTVIAQKSGDAIVDTTHLPAVERLAGAVMSYALYLRKMIWPSDLAAFYPYRHHLSVGEITLALVVLVALSVLSIARARPAPYWLFGWLWYLGLLVPVIGLVQVGAQSMADRYTYLPLVGIFVLGVWAVGDLLSGVRNGPMIGAILSALLLAACAGRTWFQEKYWHDSETLFRRDLELDPENNITGHYCLGRALFDRGADAEAGANFEEALRILPDFAPGHLNLANCLSRQGHYAEALFHYQEALRLKPEDPETYKCLGASLAAQLKLQEARTDFLTAIRFKPDYVEAYTKLGAAEMALGMTNEARQHFADAVAIYPDYVDAQYYLAHALADRMEFDEAAAHYRAAIKANPAYTDAMNDLAWMWVTHHDGRHADLPEAVELAQRACQLTQFQNAGYLETLGAALAQTGQFPQAIEIAEKAFTTTATGDQDTVARLQKQITFYRNGRGFSGGTAP